MAELPKINHPTFRTTLTDGTKVSYRPMTAADEKVLLFAKESDDDSDILPAVYQVVSSCLVDGTSIDNFSIVDLEWVFIQLFSSSVSDSIKMSYSDNEDGKVRDFSVPIKDIKITWPKPNPENKIKIDGDEMGVVMRYPPAKMYLNKDWINGKTSRVNYLLVPHCVSKIWVGSTVESAAAYDIDKLTKWVEGLPLAVFNKMLAFIDTGPMIEYDIVYKNDKGTERRIELRTLNDFFMLR